MAGAEQSIVVNTSPEVLFKVITDYEKYPQFLSEVSAVRVLERAGNTATVEYELDLIKKVSYTIKLTENAPKGVSWNLVKSSIMKSNDGGWTLEDLGGGKTKATYRLEVGMYRPDTGERLPCVYYIHGVGMFVPQRIVDKLTGTTLPETLQAFKKRAESQR